MHVFGAKHRPSIEEELSCAASPQGEECWTAPIFLYLTQGILPVGRDKIRSLKYAAARYFVHNNLLYRKSYSGVSLRCISRTEGSELLEEIHSGECGSHSAGENLARKALRQGYYWRTLRGDAKIVYQRCSSCQLHGRILRQPAEQLNPITSPWPFAMWGMDFICPFPMSTKQRRFVLVVVDYFAKWVEAIALAKPTADAVINFLWSGVFTRFGLPLAIITVNGPQFAGSRLKKFCEDHGVNLKFSSVHHPQTNGQAEAANKTIISMMKKRIIDHPGAWADDLPSLLWAYRTTPSSVTGETPFSLAFGIEAVTPSELLFLTARTHPTNRLPMEEVSNWLESNTGLLQSSLDLLPEHRARSADRAIRQKSKAARFINQKFKLRDFQVGDLVLRKAEVNGKLSDQGKFSPNWTGPFIVKEKLGKGAYRLQTHEGEDIPRTWNSFDLKLYYP